MWTKWTSNLNSDADKAEFELMINRSVPVLQRAIQILEEREADLDTQEYNTTAFDSPAWPYLQASIVGRRAELRELKKLLNLRPEGI